MIKTLVNITIDVETPQTPLIINNIKRNLLIEAGLEKILSSLHKRGLKASFFVNVYEKAVWGEQSIKDVIELINSNDQDVELHTHPFWIDSQKRENMFQLTYEEQLRVIDYGAELIEKFSSKPAICHRAGAYGINSSTILALKNRGFKADSSNFWGHPFCKYVVTDNRIVNGGSFYHFPVTHFLKNKKIIKTDINWMSVEDMCSYIKNMEQNNNAYMDLFLHSYSLLETNDYYCSYSMSNRLLEKFETMLDNLLLHNNMEILSMRESLNSTLVRDICYQV